MRITRSYYVQEPAYPPREVGELGLFHHPALFEQILKIVKENPGQTALPILKCEETAFRIYS